MLTFFKTTKEQEIVISDGAMGTLLRAKASKNIQNYESLCLNHADWIEEIHLDYLKSGAQIIRSNTFNSNYLSLKKIGLEQQTAEINKRAIEIAQKAKTRFLKKKNESCIKIAGSIGPGNINLQNFALKNALKNTSKTILELTEKVRQSFVIQCKSLIEAGADFLLLETQMDILSLKTLLSAVSIAFKQEGRKIPLLISTAMAPSGSHTYLDFFKAIEDEIKAFDILAIGANCVPQNTAVLKELQELKSYFHLPIYFSPYIGIMHNKVSEFPPNQEFVDYMAPIIENKQADILGCCCGSNAGHTRVIRWLCE